MITAFKRLVLAAAIRLAPEHPHSSCMDTPEPRRRSLEENTPEALLFDTSRTELDHSVGALSSEMNRLSGSIGGLRELMSAISKHAPVLAAEASVSPFAVLRDDAMLFDGETTAGGHETGHALGLDSELFENDAEINIMPAVYAAEHAQAA